MALVASIVAYVLDRHVSYRGHVPGGLLVFSPHVQNSDYSGFLPGHLKALRVMGWRGWMCGRRLDRERKQ